MRIHNITTPITFGYDKKLDSELRQKIKNDTTTPPELIKTIKGLSSFCNSTEKMLNDVGVVGEIDYSNNLPSLLYGTLTPAKITLAGLVENAYPDLDYTKREYDSYIREAGEIIQKTGSVYSWQFGLAAELGMSLPPEDIGGEDNEEYIDIESKAINGDVDNQEAGELSPDQWMKLHNMQSRNDAKTKEETPISEIIQKFEPGLSSPTGFESIGGMDNLKEELYDKIIYPALNPEEAKLDFEEYGKRYPRGIMLYGPPGCGKTFILEALSQEAKLPLFKLKISKAGSKYINETSKNYQSAFDYVAQEAERTGKPCIMFIDEVDGMTKGRDGEASEESLKQMGTLLNLIETARDRNIIVVAATNKYDIIDEAIRRRFDSQVYVGMPDTETREAVLYKTLAQRLKGIPLAESPEDLREIALKTQGFPSSALVILTDIASNTARKDGRRPIKKEDYLDAIEKSQNLKIDERNYQSNRARPAIGFNQPRAGFQKPGLA